MTNSEHFTKDVRALSPGADLCNLVSCCSKRVVGRVDKLQ